MATTDARLAMASLEAMRSAGVPFALLHGYERLQRGRVSDLDIVVDEDPYLILLRVASQWASHGMVPVVLWPHDIGGSACVFLSTRDASEGVQLDLLYDQRGVGRYRLKSHALLAAADITQALPVVSHTASLIYQWQKRTVKRQTAQLQELTQLATTVEATALLAASEAITGSPTAARNMIEGRMTRDAHRLSRPAERSIRLARRLMRPVGVWAHATEAAVGAQLASRFSRFLVYAETQPSPSAARQPAWWATSIMPIRLRPGVFVSTGQLPRWGTPDVLLGTLPVDAAAHRLVAAMTTRLQPPRRFPERTDAGGDRAPRE